MRLLASTLALALWLSGCDDSSCASDAVRCTCPDGSEGAAVCEDGVVGICMCAAADAGGEDAGGEDAGGQDAGGQDAGTDAGCPGTFLSLSDPPTSGAWIYAAEVGIVAGENLCATEGGHVCRYLELLEAERCGELSSLSVGATMWVHRESEVLVGGSPSSPHAGARCNDWTLATPQISDGENATWDGSSLVFELDPNPCIGMEISDGCASLTPELSCAVTRSIPCCAGPAP